MLSNDRYQNQMRNSPVQFGIRHLQWVVTLAAVFAWTVPIHLPARSISLYCLSTLLVATQVCVARWCRPEIGEDPMRVAAYDLTHAVGNYTLVAWLFVAVCFGLMRDLEVGSVNPARLLSVPIGFWLPVCLLANMLSFVLYPFWDARRLLFFRVISLAAVVVPFTWLCVEAQS